jgi:tungstate transport system substrate-binding protein
MKRIPVRVIEVVLLAAAACSRPVASPPVLFYTTPRVAATGLAERLAASFQHQSGSRVDLRIMTGEAIAARAPQGGVALVSDPVVVATLLQHDAVRLRSDLAVEDYAIIGPRSDPAKVKSAPDAVDAARRMVQKKVAFCSPRDVVALADREHLLWSAAATNPSSNRRYRPCRGSVAALLEQAAQLGAYTIVDAATLQSRLPRGLEVLMQGEPLLHDVYTLVLLKSEKPNPDAEWFVEWSMSYRGRDAVENFRSPSGRQFQTMQ